MFSGTETTCWLFLTYRNISLSNDRLIVLLVFPELQPLYNFTLLFNTQIQFEIA